MRSGMPASPTPVVYVVDDDRDNRELLAEALTAMSVVTQCFASGETALAAFLDVRVPVIVTDIHMGGMSGVDLARRIRAADPSVGVLGISGTIADELPVELFDDLLMKPVDPLEAAQRIVEEITRRS